MYKHVEICKYFLGKKHKEPLLEFSQFHIQFHIRLSVPYSKHSSSWPQNHTFGTKLLLILENYGVPIYVRLTENGRTKNCYFLQNGIPNIRNGLYMTYISYIITLSVYIWIFRTSSLIYDRYTGSDRSL